MHPALIQPCLLIVGFALLGAALPLLGRWSDRHLHLLLSVAAGTFLGTLFLELLPELPAHAHADGHDARLPWASALAGLLLLFFVERIWLRERVSDAGGHLVLWMATLIGLCGHSFIMGLGLSTLAARPEVLTTLSLAFAAHKAAEGFSLATVMRLAGLRPRRAWFWLAVFCLTTPTGILAGGQLVSDSGSPGAWSVVLEGMAAGTFLYVAAYNLLPEVFHGREQRGVRVAGLLGGVLISALTAGGAH